MIVRMAESGGRAVERKLTLPIVTDMNMIGVKPLFSGRSLGEGETATFDVILATPDGKTLARPGLRYELLKIESRYQWYRRDGNWGYEPIKLTRRIADGQIDVTADKPGRIAVPVQWGRYRLEVSSPDAERAGDLHRVRRRLVHRGDRRHAGHAGDRARQAGVQGRARP